MGLAHSEAMLFKFGSGTGTDLSTLRSHREKLSGGGKPSRPGQLHAGLRRRSPASSSSGGKTRRAAKMQTLKVWHPDILEFIECKTKEEKKAQALIEQAATRPTSTARPTARSCSRTPTSRSACTDEFLQAVENDEEWTTHWRHRPAGRWPDLPGPRRCMDKIAEGAWHCGDPGVQYDTTINALAHLPEHARRINASNPCSEYMFLDDTACNLARINLMKFRREDGTFDAERFRAACRIFIIAQEILVDHASYPTDRIAREQPPVPAAGAGLRQPRQPAHGRRPAVRLGRGPRRWPASITAIMHGQAYLTSAEHAGARRPVRRASRMNREPMLRVMEMHRDAVEEIDPPCPADLLDAARDVWDECLELGRKHGYRNSQATVLAPTGTITFMMDCDTTGIEPDIALVKYKQLAGGGMLKIVNRTVPMALQKLGYDEPAIRGDPRLHRRARHDRGGARPEGRAPAGLRLCLRAAARRARASTGGPTCG